MWENPSHIKQQKELRSSSEYKKSQSIKSKKALANPEVVAKMKKPRVNVENIRAAKLGHQQSKETIAKRVAKNIGKKRSEETKIKMSAANKAAWVIRKAKQSSEIGETV